MNLWLWLPSPETYRKRFLATGGGGYAITSGERALGAGLVYGAVAATTDGGFGHWNAQLTDVLLLSNGTLNYDMLHMFGYRAIHEMSVIGKQLTRNFFNTSSIYSYYEGCSEGGREGWSQVQRYGDQFDGVAVGAPAFRQVFLQVMHIFGTVVEAAHKYFPPPCELSRITQDAVEMCDGLDGMKDGVVSRTDLCRLHYNVSNSVGKSYSCEASAPPRWPLVAYSNTPAKKHHVKRQVGGPPVPAATGTVTSEAAKVASEFWRGMFDKSGRQVYISYPPSAPFSDSATAFDTETHAYVANIPLFGAEFVNMFLREQMTAESKLPLPMANVTSDTLTQWILDGVQKYGQILQTDWPYLEPFRSNGGKIIHYHGESDSSIPAGSSVLYHDSVRRTMYPGLSFNASHAALADWYRLFLIPGAGHCGPNPDQENGPFPQTLLGSLIEWVEYGKIPSQLNATVLGSGSLSGQEQKVCSFPLRPMWIQNGTHLQCVYDQASIDTWLPNLDGFPLPVY